MFNFFKLKPAPGPLRYIATATLESHEIEIRPIACEDYVTIRKRGYDDLEWVHNENCDPVMIHDPYSPCDLKSIKDFETPDGKVYPKTAVEHIQLTGNTEVSASIKIFFQMFKGEETAVIVGRWSKYDSWISGRRIDTRIKKISSKRVWNVDVIKKKLGIKD